jgi:hypothetical protein
MTQALVISDNLNFAESIKHSFTQVGVNSDISSVNHLLGRGTIYIKSGQFVVLVVTELLRKSIEEVDVLIKSLPKGTRFYLFFEGNYDPRFSMWAEQTEGVFKKVGLPDSLKLAINEIANIEKAVAPVTVSSTINANLIG